MTTVTDADLKELKDLITAQTKQLAAIQEEVRINAAVTNEKLLAIDRRLDTMQTSVNKIPELAEKLGELKNLRRIALIVIAGTFGSIFGWLLRSGKL